jgi:hypothetical protein
MWPAGSATSRASCEEMGRVWVEMEDGCRAREIAGCNKHTAQASMAEFNAMAIRHKILKAPDSLYSNNLVSRLLDAFSFATRATARPGKPLSLVKQIPAQKAS